MSFKTDPKNGITNHHPIFFPIHNSRIARVYFVLWRATHQPKYRDYAWKIVHAIEDRRTPSGGYRIYSGIQEPAFLSATLKYLYLTFSEDTVLPSDQWVFNEAGHPVCRLPVCGHNPIYNGKACRGYVF